MMSLLTPVNVNCHASDGRRVGSWGCEGGREFLGVGRVERGFDFVVYQREGGGW